MLGWRECAVCLIAVAVVYGTLIEDLNEFRRVVDQIETVDFLNGLLAHYPRYLRLCRAEIDVNRRSQELSGNLKAGIAALNTKLQFLTSSFVNNLRIFELGSDNFLPRTELLLLKKCERIRRAYINSAGQNIRNPKVRQFRTECVNDLRENINDVLVDGWRITNRGNTTYIQQFRQIVYDAPKTMDIAVREWIKFLIRFQVVILTETQLSGSDSQANVNVMMRDLRDDLFRVVANAKLVLKSVKDSRSRQVMEDLNRYLRLSGYSRPYNRSIEILNYLKNKYEDSDIAVMIFKRVHYWFNICGENAAYSVHVGEWSGAVDMTYAAHDGEATKERKRKLMVGVLRKIPKEITVGRQAIKMEELKRKLISAIGGIPNMCRKFSVITIADQNCDMYAKTSGYVIYEDWYRVSSKCGGSRTCSTNFRIILMD